MGKGGRRENWESGRWESWEKKEEKLKFNAGKEKFEESEEKLDEKKKNMEEKENLKEWGRKAIKRKGRKVGRREKFA